MLLSWLKIPKVVAMNKIFFKLLYYPALLGPIISSLTIANPAHAKEFVFEAPHGTSCQQPSRMENLVCVRLRDADQTDSAVTSESNPEDETPMLGFTEEDSDAAIAMFGCDCIVCINAIRQLNGLPPV